MSDKKPYVCPLENFWTKPSLDDIESFDIEQLKDAFADEREHVEMRQHQYEESCKRRKELQEEIKQLRLVLSYCGVNRSSSDTCGCCGLHFADCEADLMCYGIDCASCEGEFSGQCHVCNGKELYCEEFWSCPGAHARAAIK